MENIWPKRITVDKRIVSLLSVSTYANFPSAVKEIITNSYDADARNVDIKISLDEEIITVFDDGKGMTEEDFSFYIRIAGKSREKTDNVTKMGRRIIGQFGVGFLSVFPFFKSYKIESKKAGSNKVLFANIPLHKYFIDSNKPIDIGSIIINGGQRIVKEDIGKSYTRITLTGFSDLTRHFLNDNDGDIKYNSRNVETYNGIDKLRWVLADNLPLKYRDEKFNQLFDYPEIQNFNVKINNSDLFREVYASNILEQQENEYLQIGKIKCKYFIASPERAVFPFEARYLKVRNLNVGVGEKREHFGVAHGATRSRLHWLTGEVHIIDGMNDQINLSRDDFSYNNDYEELKRIFNQKLNYHSNRLEKQADLSREIRQTGESFKIQDIKLLDPELIERKIEALKQEGIELGKNVQTSAVATIFHEERSQILFPTTQNETRNFEKRIFIEDQDYLVSVDSWDYENELFKACKLDDNNIIINDKYPLFKGKKYTDVFLKMHLMLIFRYINMDIDDQLFTNLNNDILKFFKEYI